MFNIMSPVVKLAVKTLGSERNRNFYTFLMSYCINVLCCINVLQIIPNGRVTIVSPETKMPCAHTDLGEVINQQNNKNNFTYSNDL